MTAVVLERVQTPYSQLHSGAQLSLRDLDAYRIALCAADRLLQAPLPREATDIPCDYILTERR